MESNNWRPPQGGEPSMDAGDWRSQLQSDSRQRIVNKIMDTLKRHLPFSGQEGLHELKKIAVRFEEKIYTAATSQSDYLRKISLKMLTMETKSQSTMANSLQTNPASNSNRPPDPGSFVMQPQVPNQGQSLPMPLPANQSQTRQQLLSQNIQNNIPPTGVQSSAGLPSALPPASGLTQTPVPSIVGQSTNMQSMSGTSQNSLGNPMGQGVPSNMFANSQRQMPGRQQVVPQQQQQQSQNSQQYMYQQQLQQQLLKPKFQQGNIQLVQNHMQQQQQQQQNLLQPTQLQSSQQSVMQSSSVMQPSTVQSSLSSLQQNQQSAIQHPSQSMLQQHPSVLRQQQQPQQSSVVHQQQTPIPQQPILPSQQQQQQPQLMVQQPNSTNLPQNQLIGQQNSVGDMQQQQQQQQQRLLSQQNNILNLQQQQQQQQQQQHQLMAQQNNLSNMHQQQLGPQSNVTGLQQQQHLGTQTGNSSMQTNQHSALMLQSKVQQQHQSPSNLLPAQGHQSQPQASQQQLLSQIQSQPAQMQQQMGMQQQSNPLQRDMQQRLQASGQVSGSMLQPPNVMDQQKQLYQPQRAPPDTSPNSTAQTGHTNGADWQEEVYQKIKVMKEMYYPELSEMYQKIAAKLQQHDSLPQQPKSDQLEKLKMFKAMLERLITVLQVSKPSISPSLKDKLGLYEKQIINFINTNRPRKPVSSLQQGQLPPPHMHSMQQSQSQITQVQSHENQMNPQLQSMNLQGSVPTMQQNNMTGMQQNSMSSLSGVSTVQQNMMNPLQPSSNMDPGQGNALNSLQQVPVGSIQQTSVSAPQQANMNALSSQMLQGNINPLQSNSGILHNQHLKQEQQQQQQQQMYQNQFKQQLQHRQMQPQLMQKQQIIQQQLQHRQQLHQQAKQQLPGQLQTHQMPQLHQINDVNDVKMRPGMGVKPGAFQQHLSVGQRAYSHQQLKLGSPFPITSSAQLLQVQCPQISQHSSPQVDQQNLLVPKAGTPLQTASSPFVIPSPSTPMAPSPMPGDSEKPSSLSNAANIGHQQTTGAGALVQSLAIGTPGISASPLLAEFSGPDGTHANALSTMSGKSSVTEQPLECLIKADSKASSVQPQKMLTFLNKPQKTMVNSLESNGAGNSNGLLNPGSSGVQPQVTNQGQSVSMPLPANQSQARLQFVPWNIQNNVLPSGVQSSAGLSSALSPTMHYHLYYLQPPAAGQNMSGLSSARPPALFPAGALTAQQNMMNLSRPISSMVPGQGHAPKNLLQQVPVGSIQQTPVSAPQQANMNALSSQNGINMPQTNISQQQRLQQIFQQRQQQRPGQSLTHQMPQLHPISVVNDVSKNASSSPSGSTMLQASIDSLKSNSGIVDNQHLKQEQEQKMFQKQLKLPYQQLLMRQPQILQDKQQQQIQQLQQQAKQQLRHIYFIYLIFLTILLGAAFFGTGY